MNLNRAAAEYAMAVAVERKLDAEVKELEGQKEAVSRVYWAKVEEATEANRRARKAAENLLRAAEGTT